MMGTKGELLLYISIVFSKTLSQEIIQYRKKTNGGERVSENVLPVNR